MTPQSYATSLIYRGHTPQSVKLATGCDVSDRANRPAFDPVRLKSPMRSGDEKLGPPTYTRRMKIMAEIEAIAVREGISTVEIMGENRQRIFSWPRQEAYYVLRHKWKLSLPAIGKIMKRDHATVLYGVRKHAARVISMETDDGLR